MLNNLSKAPLSEARFLKSDEVMRMLGYTDASAFWVSVKAAGIPRIMINRRRALFEESAVRAWLDSKTVGGRAA